MTTLDLPHSNYTAATGINANGVIVGDYCDATGQHGFVYQDQRFSAIDHPEATTTSLRGINTAGDIVGSYGNAQGQQGFIKQGDTFITIAPPASIDTSAHGINAWGQAVGLCYNGLAYQGFLATPQPLSTSHLGPVRQALATRVAAWVRRHWRQLHQVE